MHNTGRRASTARLKRRRERRSGGSPFVVVMQTADVWNWHDRAAGWRLVDPRDRSILVERQMSPPLVVVGEVASKVAVQRALVRSPASLSKHAPSGPTPISLWLRHAIRRRHGAGELRGGKLGNEGSGSGDRCTSFASRVESRTWRSTGDGQTLGAELEVPEWNDDVRGRDSALTLADGKLWCRK
jgi:hypothetical protein